MPTFTPVDFDPFAGPPAGGVQTVPGQNGAPTRVIMDMGKPSEPKLVPVDHDPFAEPSMAADVVKSAGVGVAKGALGIAGAAGDLRSYLSLGIDAAARKFGVPAERVQSFKDALYEGMTRASGPTSILANAPTTSDLQGQVEKVTGPFYKPQTTAGEYAQTAGEFLPAAFGGEASWLSRGARVLTPAAASETAGQVTKGRDIEPVARFLGALAGGGITAAAERPGSAARSISNQLPEGVTPQMVDQAKTLMVQARQQGIDLAWPEALSQVAQDLQTGPNAANGAKFRAALIGNPQQRANLQAAVEALPNGQERWQGFNRLLDIMEATGTRQGIGSRTAYNDMINEMQKAGGMVQTGAKVAAQPLGFLKPLADKYDQWKLGRNLSEAARILTDPRSANMLRALVRTRDGGRSAALAVRLLTFADASRVQ